MGEGWGFRKLFNHPTSTSNRACWQLLGVCIVSFQGCMCCSQESMAVWSRVGQQLASEDKKEDPMTRAISPLPVLITRLSNTNALGFLGLQTDAFCWPNILCSVPLKRPLKGRFKDTHSCDFFNDVTLKWQQNLFNFSVSVKSSSLQSF